MQAFQICKSKAHPAQTAEEARTFHQEPEVFQPHAWGLATKLSGDGDAQEAIVVHLTKHRNEGNPVLSEEDWQILADLHCVASLQ